MEKVLEMKNIVKTYGRVVANDDISIDLRKGEILAIVGENGAGKSTLMKILYGLEKADSGEIFLHGKPVKITSPSVAMDLQIGMVQQHFMLFGPMTVTENIVYNNEISKYSFFDKKKNEEKVAELSERYGLKVDPTAIVDNCPVGTQQRIEILKTLYQNADIIIFDEPSAVLTPNEVDDLLDTMKNLAAAGKSLIIITHKLNEVMYVADRVVVLRAGKLIDVVNKKDTSIEQLSYMMIGRQVANLEIVEHDSSETLLKVENLTLGSELGKKVLDNVNLYVNAGEIVGIAGVSGNGQTELVRCISGLERNYQGKVTVNGSDVSNFDVAAIRKAGLSHIPEDRYMWGSAREATISDNILMGEEDSIRFSKNGILKQKEIDGYADKLIGEYSIKVDNNKQKIKELSGGNAQKVITAREVERDCPFTIACEPTRGIDIGAMEFVHERLVAKRDKFGGILLVTSELSEIMKLCDRIYVMYNGSINYEFKNEDIDDHKLGVLMLGGKVDENKVVN
jgi:ABC-type uncharacterized transport system ATPase subunit